jgi:hypothetical protein
MMHKHLLDALDAYEQGHADVRAHAKEAAQRKGHRPERKIADASPATAQVDVRDGDDDE